MAAFKVVCALLVVVVAVSAQHGYEGGYDFGQSYGGAIGAPGVGGHALGGGGGDDGGHGHEDYHHHPSYKFEYAVHDPKHHDIHKHSEHRDGDKTEGEYSLHEADGTVRTVKYHVHGKSGFVATVHRSGHAVHPQVHHAAPVHHYDGAGLEGYHHA